MMQFQISNEKKILSGKKYKDIAESLKNGSLFASEEDLATYMKGFASRYETQTGQKIAYNNATNFVKSLIKVGYLIEK